MRFLEGGGLYVFCALMMCTFFLIVNPATDTITIEKPYYQEWKSCEAELEAMIPVCPEVECVGDINFIGILLMIIIGIITGNRISEELEKWLKKDEKKYKVKKK